MSTKVGPHEYSPINLLDRLLGDGGRCVACYAPKRAHPVDCYVTARPIGSSAPANWPHGATWPMRLGVWKNDAPPEED